ncbi:MAG: uridine kinase [Mycobacteriales bacterium]
MLAQDLAEALRALGRRPLVVPAEGFWRPAGERFQHGREDWQAFRDSWLDAGALRREVLDADGTWLPALWDVARDRSARLTAQPVPDRAVVVVHGLFLQGLGLPAELTVHVALSPAALLRRGVPAWQLEAFTSYDEELAPGDLADVLVRAEDPLRPAVRWPGQTRR